MTIAQAFNDIAIAQGGTASKIGTIAGAIDALNDALAGSDQKAAQTIEDAVRLLGQNIGSGGGTEYDIKCYIATGESTIEETTDRMLLFDPSTLTPSSEPANKAKGGDMLVTTSSILTTFLCESFPPDIQSGISIPNSGNAVVMPNAKLAVIVNGEIH